MLKNNKILIFLFMFFSVCILFTSSVFASTDTYSFTGFDGKSYNLPPLPEGINNYKHYIIVSDNGSLKLFGFNESLKITRDESFVNFNFDDKTTGKLFDFIDSENEWEEMGEQQYYSLSIDTTLVINSCSDLLQYKDRFNGPGDFFYNPPIVEATGILAPIYQKTPLEETLQEVVMILPVILMTIVGLIGLRKALKFLSKVLHRS